ncbi:20130_t:CDS:2, partial [Rhizophagus irregularis]
EYTAIISSPSVIVRDHALFRQLRVSLNTYLVLVVECAIERAL